MNGQVLSLRLTLLALAAMATGGITASVAGELNNLALALLWVGLLALLLVLYVNFPRLRTLLGQRSTRYGANLVVMIALFLVILGMISAMSIKHKIRLDLTADARYSLSPQTVKLLKTLDRDVEAIAFYREDERTRQAMVDLLQEYSYHSPRFKYWFVDPDKKPAEAARYGVTSYRTTLLRSGSRQEVVGHESENKVTNGLMKILRDQVKTVYFVNGHGENSLADESEYGYRTAQKALEEEHYQVRELQLVGETTIPPEASLLVVSGPRRDLEPAELAKIDAFVLQGGGVLFQLDPAPLPKTLDYLAGHGFKIGNDIIIDKLIRILGTNYLTPVVMDYEHEHPLTQDLTNLNTFFPLARSVEIDRDPARGRYVLARTSTSSWARSKGEIKDDNVVFDETQDRRGPLGIMAVAVVARSTTFGRLVVIGDANFAGNTHLKLAGNRDLFLNTVNWLAKDETLIAIRQKDPTLSPMTLTDAQGRLVFWLAVVIGPTLFLMAGAAVALRRRVRA